MKREETYRADVRVKSQQEGPAEIHVVVLESSKHPEQVGQTLIYRYGGRKYEHTETLPVTVEEQ